MKRVLTAEFSHETNTFCVVPTSLDNFRRQAYICDPAQVKLQRLGTKSCLGASFEAANKFNWELIAPVCATSNPTGRVLAETFDHICDLIFAPLISSSFDGILLHLHGAMVTEQHEDAEGELLRRLRDIAGNHIPVVVTLDLHGNITEAMAKHASALIAVRTYPHIDFYERAWQGAELLERAMNKEINLKTVIAKRPQLKGLDGGRTQTGPMRELIDKGEELEQQGKVLVASICSGFTAADIKDIGPSVTITYDSKFDDESNTFAMRSQAQSLAEEMMDVCWQQRAFTSVNHLSIEAAVALAKKQQDEMEKCSSKGDGLRGPLVMSDVTDNPGSGHYGDSTALLEAILAAHLTNVVFYAIYDPAAALQGAAIGVGNKGTVTLGGKHDPTAGGGPLTLTGTVVTLSDGNFPAYGIMCGGVWQQYGLSMLFRVDGIDICVISNNGQCLDLAQITSLGCDPRYKTTVALKSNHHFRAAFGDIARDIVTVNGGGLGSFILSGGAGRYKNVRRPIWPLDGEEEAVYASKI